MKDMVDTVCSYVTNMSTGTKQLSLYEVLVLVKVTMVVMKRHDQLQRGEEEVCVTSTSTALFTEGS